MRLIDSDALPSVKFHALPYTHITPSDVNVESYERGWNDAIDAIVDCAPTIDAVPVVRCKDCRHLKVVMKEPVYAVCEKTNHTFYLWQEDTRKHFCSWGEWAEGKTMRLIDADATLTALTAYWDSRCMPPVLDGETATYVDCKLIIKRQPTIDAVPVVRCKDCKYYLRSNEECQLIDTRLRFYETRKTWTGESHCSWGERKDSAHEDKT